jgi:hypothetical protein
VADRSDRAGSAGPNGRRRRSDHGSTRFSERDGELLSLIGEQHALTVPQLARVTGSGIDTAYQLRNRWRRAGWVESRPLLRYGPAFVWLTSEGAKVAQSPFRVIAPNPGLAAHTAAVTDVRLLVEHELGLGLWHCERELMSVARTPGKQGPRLPDAVLDRDGLRIAVEVELSLKGATRLDLILDEHARRYPEVWYFAAPRVEPALRSLVAGTPWRNIRVHPFPPTAEGLGR